MFGMTSLTMKLLGVVSVCLVTWCEITFGDEKGPVVVEEGSDVILPCSLSINIESKLFDWKKDGQKEVFLYDEGHHYNKDRTGQDEHFKGRVSHFQDQLKRGNASIIIRNTKVSDSGNYTCAFPRLQPSHIFHIQLVVGAAREPTVKILDMTKDWALLQCVVHSAFPKPKVKWHDSSGNILHAEEPEVTERGGSYDIILNTTVTKTDKYRCVVTQEEISHQIYAETSVYIQGAASKPFVQALGQTDHGMLLQCEVLGASPKPKVKWQDSSGNILPAKEPKVTERGGSYDIILNTTVTKTDKYRCVVTQEEINHQTEAETYVHISEFPTGLVVGAVLGAVVVTLLVVGVVAVLYNKYWNSRNSKKGPQTEKMREEQRDSSHSDNLIQKV